MKSTAYRIEDGIYSIEASLVCCGNDLNLLVCGGTKPHIGACAIGIPRPSLQNPSEISSSVSVFCVTGHKDDEIARFLAGALASHFQCTVLVSAGIHIDNAKEQDIHRLGENCRSILRLIKEGYTIS